MRKAKRSTGRTRQVGPDDILPEYDFSRARPNKYASRYAKGSIVVTLDTDVAVVFSGAREANDALRALAGDSTPSATAAIATERITSQSSRPPGSHSLARGCSQRRYFGEATCGGEYRAGRRALLFTLKKLRGRT